MLPAGLGLFCESAALHGSGQLPQLPRDANAAITVSSLVHEEALLDRAGLDDVESVNRIVYLLTRPVRMSDGQDG